jgi:sugar phosphate isomerase/epimerase
MNLNDMRDEVQRFCLAKGWYDTPVKFLESMALLHTEIVEMDDAYASHGLEPFESACGGPDGVAIELADILIRALDDMGRYNLEITPTDYVFTSPPRVQNLIRELHARVVDCTEAYRVHGIDECEGGVAEKLSIVIAAVRMFAIIFQLNLFAAYREKMDYNFKREHRHGGKLA